METLARYQVSYQEFKQELDSEMQKTVEGFVKIGFLLNYATETNIVKEGGYDNVNAFAKAEYGIDATQVSRFVNIYRRFGEPGMPRLQTQYMNHGVAKLSIMLTLPDYVNEDIPSGYTKTEINAIKTEVEAEQKISDLEVMMEEKDPVQQSLPEGLKQVVYQMVHDYPQIYLRMYDAIGIEKMKEVVAPDGASTYTVRVPGTGKMFLVAKATENIVITNLRTGDKEYYEWQQLYSALEEYFDMGGDAKESWTNTFKEPFPEEEKQEEKPENDNVQQSSKPEPKKEPKKESKVKVATPKPVKKEEPVKAPVEPVEEESQEALTGEVEDIVAEDDNTVDNNVQQSSEEIAPVQENSTIKGYKAAVHGSINRLEKLFNEEKWDELIVEAEKIVWRTKQIKVAGEK